MPCLLGLLALFVPRLVIILLVIFSDYIGRGFSGTAAYPLIPILGFLFMPVSTLAYAFAINNGGGFGPLDTVLLVLAVLLDLGLLGGGAASRRDNFPPGRVKRVKNTA
ncbi:MAG TPA: hypothetical protein VD963_08460 [Phycisphaerales bacterium]|nr:hypothetical protein [Phycisphaerales bacterium]